MSTKIIIDAFGGDNAPPEVLKGAADAVAEYGVTVVLCGDEAKLRQVAEQNSVPLTGLEFLNATDVITMEDEPRSILKAHKDCSMAVGLRALAAGEGDAFVSGGSTGALLMGATFLVKRIKGVSRPALGTMLPSDKQPFLLLDMGANVDCRPEMLLQFAQMGSLYVSETVRPGQPARVGLLNVGTEDTKGGELQHGAFELLQNSGLDFIGNVEARDVPFGAADVVVADGFAGNVLLKSMEGMASLVMHSVKNAMTANVFTKLLAAGLLPKLKGLKQKMDTRTYGGAVLLGVQKPVIKAHGNSDALAFKNAIRVAADCAKAHLIDKIADAMAKQPTPDETDTKETD